MLIMTNIFFNDLISNLAEWKVGKAFMEVLKSDKPIAVRLEDTLVDVAYSNNRYITKDMLPIQRYNAFYLTQGRKCDIKCDKALIKQAPVFYPLYSVLATLAEADFPVVLYSDFLKACDHEIAAVLGFQVKPTMAILKNKEKYCLVSAYIEDKPNILIARSFNSSFFSQKS